MTTWTTTTTNDDHGDRKENQKDARAALCSPQSERFYQELSECCAGSHCLMLLLLKKRRSRWLREMANEFGLGGLRSATEILDRVERQIWTEIRDRVANEKHGDHCMQPVVRFTKPGVLRALVVEYPELVDAHEDFYCHAAKSFRAHAMKGNKNGSLFLRQSRRGPTTLDNIRRFIGEIDFRRAHAFLNDGRNPEEVRRTFKEVFDQL